MNNRKILSVSKKDPLNTVYNVAYAVIFVGAAFGAMAMANWAFQGATPT